MKKNNPTMTSREAAALLVSKGSTDDADMANLMAEGSLDPDKLSRAYFRKHIGFDFTVTEGRYHYTITDTDTGATVTSPMTDDNEITASKLSKAVMKLKKMHEAGQHKDVIEGEIV